MDIERRTPTSIWRTKGKDNKSTGTFPSKRESKFRVETNALGHAIGGVLSQEQKGK